MKEKLKTLAWAALGVIGGLTVAGLIVAAMFNVMVTLQIIFVVILAMFVVMLFCALWGHISGGLK